jgi:hypothetical protein
MRGFYRYCGQIREKLSNIHLLTVHRLFLNVARPRHPTKVQAEIVPPNQEPTTSSGGRVLRTSGQTGSPQGPEENLEPAENLMMPAEVPTVHGRLPIRNGRIDTAPILNRFDHSAGEIIVLKDSLTDLPVVILTHYMLDIANEIRDRRRDLRNLEKGVEIASSQLKKAKRKFSWSRQKLLGKDLSKERSAELQREIEDSEALIYKYGRRKTELEDLRGILSQRQDHAAADFYTRIEAGLMKAGFMAPDVVDDSAGPKSLADRISESPPQASASALVSNEELLRRAVMARLHDAERELEDAHARFDDRTHVHNDRLHAWNKAINAGHCSYSLTDIGYENIRYASKLARELDAAEIKHEEAIKAAWELKVLPTHYDQESYFVSRTSDGYLEACDLAAQAQLDTLYIQEWIKEVNSVATKEGVSMEEGLLDLKRKIEGCDHWDAESVGMSDSVSVVDFTRNRRRIDRWRKKCGW